MQDDALLDKALIKRKALFIDKGCAVFKDTAYARKERLGRKRHVYLAFIVLTFKVPFAV